MAARRRWPRIGSGHAAGLGGLQAGCGEPNGLGRARRREGLNADSERPSSFSEGKGLGWFGPGHGSARRGVARTPASKSAGGQGAVPASQARPVQAHQRSRLTPDTSLNLRAGRPGRGGQGRAGQGRPLARPSAGTPGRRSGSRSNWRGTSAWPSDRDVDLDAVAVGPEGPSEGAPPRPGQALARLARLARTPRGRSADSAALADPADPAAAQ